MITLWKVLFYFLTGGNICLAGISAFIFQSCDFLHHIKKDLITKALLQGSALVFIMGATLWFSPKE
jgi:hypothetical protein